MHLLGFILTCGLAGNLAAGETAVAPLEELVTRIDSKLVEESERDIRAWLDARIAATGDFGVYPFMRDELRLEGDIEESFRTLKGDLGATSIQMLDVTIPATDGRQLRMKRHTKPKKVHQLLLDQLNFTLPAHPPPEIQSLWWRPFEKMNAISTIWNRKTTKQRKSG